MADDPLVPQDELNKMGPEVCHIPSCRMRGTDHAGYCRSINGDVQIGPDRGPRAETKQWPPPMETKDMPT